VTEILTIAEPFRHEIDKIKGSRFIATAQPAQCPEDALALASDLRIQMPDATHHCWAWRGTGRDAWRYSDDGEPSGSAGRPILNAIDGRKLCCVAVVVTRYFGGTKLGTGGLSRAYACAAAAALDLAPRRRYVLARLVTLDFPYSLSGPVQGHLREHRLSPAQAEYGERVRMALHVPANRLSEFVSGLAERTAQGVRVVVGDSLDVPGDDPTSGDIR
jgi:uncharacterized YigZ family protein